MTKEISLYGQKIFQEDGTYICMFTDNEGNRCKKEATWEHRQGRFYCDEDHNLVNKINKERELEAVTKLKENINKYLDKQSINCAEQQELIKDLKNQLNNGNLDV